MTTFYNNHAEQSRIQRDLLDLIKQTTPRQYRYGPSDAAFRAIHTDLCRPHGAPVHAAWEYWMACAGGAVVYLNITPDAYEHAIKALLRKHVNVDL